MVVPSQPLLNDLFPKVIMMSFIVIIEHFANNGAGAGAFEEFPGLIAEEFLVFRKVKIHCVRSQFGVFRAACARHILCVLAE
jgi:hypothetical protein